MKNQFWSVLLCLALAFSLVPAFAPGARAATEGVCGEDVTWELTDDGTLWIYGDGAMEDYAEDTPTPWEKIRGDIKAVIIGRDVTHIGSCAFQGCNNLTELTADYDTLKSVGAYAFAVSSLREVELPDSVTSIGYAAFDSCKQLETILLPPGLTEIAQYLFCGCTALPEIDIPEGVTKIGEEAFNGCAALAAAALPKSLTSVEKNAFNGCDALTTVYYGGTNTDWYNNLNHTIADGNAPLKIAKNRWETYSGTCGASGNNLTWVLSRNTLTISGTGAMKDYAEKDHHAPWYDHAWLDIKNVVVEEGVTHIGAYAFDGCGAIGVDIPLSVTSFGKKVLDSRWFHIYYHGSETDRKSIEGVNSKDNRNLVDAQWYYNCGRGTCGETLTWTFCDGTLAIGGRGKMPDYGGSAWTPWQEHKDSVTKLVVGAGVTKIGNCAFDSLEKLESVTLPRSVRKVGAVAFGRSGTAFRAVYYGGDEADRAALEENIAQRLNDRLRVAPWYYCCDGPAKLSCYYSYSAKSLTYTVTNAPKGALLIAAHYDESGKMDYVRVMEPERGAKESTIEVPCDELGTVYRLMLVDGSTFAPLCKADSSYVDNEWDG